ncbi:histidine kinase [Nocardiopsis sp. CNR-923]|uniref:ATP-binding protein n=1 Tax=Nocardiopsis sp. CNR-923 TaxID=1904965 RepID=UPI000962478A|nr:ATP-binding protein [Nocardiopsis sp. CNR-923]OLT27018.1 histidine kinase [Nocardiopsis sp. CNR-923]
MLANYAMPSLGDVTVPLSTFIRPRCRHYFSGRPERSHFRVRRYDFPGTPVVMPLVRAFLDTCAVTESEDYRYLFTLLGSELANNAIQHTRSGLPGGTYSLVVDRHRDGLHLVCRDNGTMGCAKEGVPAANPDGLCLNAESGRGLTLVDAFATDWGSDARGRTHHVWCYLAFDLEDSLWDTSPAA